MAGGIVRCVVLTLQGGDTVPEGSDLRLGLAGSSDWAACLDAHALHYPNRANASPVRAAVLPGASAEGVEVVAHLSRPSCDDLVACSSLLQPGMSSETALRLGNSSPGTNIGRDAYLAQPFELTLSLSALTGPPGLHTHVLNRDPSHRLHAWTSASGWRTVNPSACDRLSTDGGGALKLIRERDGSECALPLQLQSGTTGKHVLVDFDGGPGACLRLCGTGSMNSERIDLRVIRIRSGASILSELAICPIESSADDSAAQSHPPEHSDSKNVSSTQRSGHWSWERLECSRGNASIAVPDDTSGATDVMPLPLSWHWDHISSVCVDHLKCWEGEIMLEAGSMQLKESSNESGTHAIGRRKIEAPQSLSGEWECHRNLRLGTEIELDVALRRIESSKAVAWQVSEKSAETLASDISHLQQALAHAFFARRRRTQEQASTSGDKARHEQENGDDQRLQSEDDAKEQGDGAEADTQGARYPGAGGSVPVVSASKFDRRHQQERANAEATTSKRAYRGTTTRERQLEQEVQRLKSNLKRAQDIEKQHEELLQEHQKLSADYLSKQRDAQTLDKARDTVMKQRQVIERLESVLGRHMERCDKEKDDAAVQVDATGSIDLSESDRSESENSQPDSDGEGKRVEREPKKSEEVHGERESKEDDEYYKGLEEESEVMSEEDGSEIESDLVRKYDHKCASRRSTALESQEGALNDNKS